MNTYLLMLAGSATFLLFVVLLGTAIWKDLSGLRRYVRRHWSQSSRFREPKSFCRIREPEPRSLNLEKVWLMFGD